MILASEIRSQAGRWNLPEETIEKDYVLGWVLWGIANHSDLSRQWFFRGGTCLKKCYVDTHRYSEDLDFTVLPRGIAEPDDLRSIFAAILPEVSVASGVDFRVRDPRFRLRPGGGSIEGRVYFRGPRNTPTPVSVKLDLVTAEPVVRPPVIRPIGHPYTDEFPPSDQVYCYNLEELFAEKIRAMSDRCRPRDLYDIVYLYRRSDLHAEPELIHVVLKQKCEMKGLPLPDFEFLATSGCHDEIESSWQSMLGHQIGTLPNFQEHWADLPQLLGWLEGKEISEDMEPLVPIDKAEAWEPPPIDWEPGEEERLEPVRFAAVNRLLLDLGYKGSSRKIEPYSLRRTRAGHILLLGIRTDNRQIRAYRIDRIQRISVSNIPFKPIHRIEFSPEGRISSPPVRRGSPRIGSRPAYRGLGGYAQIYVVECSYCGKKFPRKRLNLKLRAHKQPASNLDCPGRTRFLVDTYTD